MRPAPEGFLKAPARAVRRARAAAARSTRCRPAWAAPASCSPSSTRASAPTRSGSPRRWATGCPSARWSAPRRRARRSPPGTHGSTFGGNLVAAAAADGHRPHGQRPARCSPSNLEKGEYFLARGRADAGAHPALVERRARARAAARHRADVRRRRRSSPAAASAGLLCNLAGERTVRFAPPFIVTRDELDEGLAHPRRSRHVVGAGPHHSVAGLTTSGSCTLASRSSRPRRGAKRLAQRHGSHPARCPLPKRWISTQDRKREILACEALLGPRRLRRCSGVKPGATRRRGEAGVLRGQPRLPPRPLLREEPGQLPQPAGADLPAAERGPRDAHRGAARARARAGSAAERPQPRGTPRPAGARPRGRPARRPSAGPGSPATRTWRSKARAVEPGRGGAAADADRAGEGAARCLEQAKALGGDAGARTRAAAGGRGQAAAGEHGAPRTR